MSAPDVVVALATRFATLEHRDTRWGAVLRAWAASGRRFDVLDFPRFSLRPRVIVRSAESWLLGVRVWDVTFPLTRPRRLPHDAFVAHFAARRLFRVIGDDPATRLVVTAPIWTELALASRKRWGFDAVDDWRALPWAAPYAARITRGYTDIATASSATAVSASLATTVEALAGRSVATVANGVDLGRFRHPADPPAGLPSAPFAVYVGNVQTLDRVLLEHVRAVVDAGLPVAIAGSTSAESSAELRRTGAHLLGEVPREQLPGLLQRATVGLVPHRASSLTASMDPMKTLEYLAAGLPVVTTPVAARGEYADRITVATTPAEFAAAAIAAASLPRALPRASLRSWATVADELWALHVGA